MVTENGFTSEGRRSVSLGGNLGGNWGVLPPERRLGRELFTELPLHALYRP